MTPENPPTPSVERTTSQPKPIYYQPPTSHETHYQSMVKWLVISFTMLFFMAVLFFIFADKVLMSLPFSAEKKFVRPYEEITRYFDDEQNSPARESIERYLDELTAGIANDMSLPEGMKIEVHYLDTDAVNAFATLGGHIFICRGLIEKLKDENSLAMIIGHEVAHIKNRDPIVGMTRGLTIQMLYSYFTGDYAHLDLGGLSGQLGLTYFSREQERQADKEGIKALHSHYGHVAGYDSLFIALMSEQEKKSGEIHIKDVDSNWLSSHPDLRERISDLSIQILNNGWELQGVKTYPAYVEKALKKISENKVLNEHQH